MNRRSFFRFFAAAPVAVTAAAATATASTLNAAELAVVVKDIADAGHRAHRNADCAFVLYQALSGHVRSHNAVVRLAETTLKIFNLGDGDSRAVASGLSNFSGLFAKWISGVEGVRIARIERLLFMADPAAFTSSPGCVWVRPLPSALARFNPEEGALALISIFEQAARGIDERYALMSGLKWRDFGFLDLAPEVTFIRRKRLQTFEQTVRSYCAAGVSA